MMSKSLRQKGAWSRTANVDPHGGVHSRRARGEAAEEQSVDGRAQPPRAGKCRHDALRRPQPSLPLRVESDAESSGGGAGEDVKLS